MWGNNMSTSTIDRYQQLTLAYMSLCSLAIFAYAILNPLYVWDMLGYVAAVHQLNGVDTSQLHHYVFSELKANTTSAVFQELTSGTPYRLTMSKDPEAFIQQIPFYNIRVLFVLLIDAMSKLGLGLYESIHVLTAGFGASALIIVYIGLREQIHSLFWLTTPLAIYAVTTDIELLQQGGVDTFAFFWMCLILVFYVRASKLLLPALAISVLVRTDLIILAAIIFALLLFQDKSNRKVIIAWGVATLVIYFSINAWAGNYGWYTLIHFVFVTDMSATHPAVYSQFKSFGLYDYLGFLFSLHSWISKWFWVCIGCSLVSLFVYGFLYKKHYQQLHDKSFVGMQRMNIFCVISIAYIILHYMLFPAFFMRFFIGSCFFMILSMFSSFSYLSHARGESEDVLQRVLITRN